MYVLKLINRNRHGGTNKRLLRSYEKKRERVFSSLNFLVNLKYRATLSVSFSTKSKLTYSHFRFEKLILKTQKPTMPYEWTFRAC